MLYSEVVRSYPRRGRALASTTPFHAFSPSSPHSCLPIGRARFTASISGLSRSPSTCPTASVSLLPSLPSRYPGHLRFIPPFAPYQAQAVAGSLAACIGPFNLDSITTTNPTPPLNLQFRRVPHHLPSPPSVPPYVVPFTTPGEKFGGEYCQSFFGSSATPAHTQRTHAQLAHWRTREMPHSPGT